MNLKRPWLALLVCLLLWSKGSCGQQHIGAESNNKGSRLESSEASYSDHRRLANDLGRTVPEGTCERPLKLHHGMRILAKDKKRFYSVGELLVFQCHTGLTASAECQLNGDWSRGPIFCPDPANKTCSYIDPPDHGRMDLIKPRGAAIDAPNFTYRTNVKFVCDSGYQLVGAPILVCDIRFRWSHDVPKCIYKLVMRSPISTKLKVLLIIISILLMGCIAASVALIYRWRKRSLQRKRWQRYFGNYTSRQSKTNITSSSNSNQEMKLFKQQEKTPAIPVTDL